MKRLLPVHVVVALYLSIPAYATSQTLTGDQPACSALSGVALHAVAGALGAQIAQARHGALLHGGARSMAAQLGPGDGTAEVG